MVEATLDGFGTGVDAEGICVGTDDGDADEEVCRRGVLVGANVAELE
jgi:hypothetical protein